MDDIKKSEYKNNSGQATGIIGLILPFAGLAPIGIILSVISTFKSKKSNDSAILGVIGIIINFLATVAFIFLVLVITLWSPKN